MTWILILFCHVGPFGNGNSNSLAVVPGFQAKGECENAGKAAERLASNTYKEIRYACVEQTQPKGKSIQELMTTNTGAPR